MPQTTNILLIGGGIASASAAVELRRSGFTGKVMLVTREMLAPYHRPPITKALLWSAEVADLSVLPPQWWSDNDIELLTRSAVTDLDTNGRIARLANGRILHYDKALLATGAMVRRLTVEGAALRGVHYLRAPANAHSLRGEAAEAEQIVLVGGSFIAVEVAASFARQGRLCTLVMQERSCLDLVFGGTVSTYVDGLLRSHGVEIVPHAQVVAFTGDGSVRGVRTADGTEIPADLVVVGAGAVPDSKLAAKAGLAIGETGGVRCDAHLRTSHEHIYAAGDVCEYASPVHGRQVRVEHERHAAAQGVTVARNMLGAAVEHTEVPYFWTDIADWATLEYVGVATDWDAEVVTGSPEAGDFTVWYLQQGRLVAALTSGRPVDLDVARERISRGAGLPDGIGLPPRCDA